MGNRCAASPVPAPHPHPHLLIVYPQVPAFLGAGARHFGFMLRGMRQLDAKLQALGIPFFLLKGDPTETVPALVAGSKAGLLVTDYSPLRLGKLWRQQVRQRAAMGALAGRRC